MNYIILLVVVIAIIIAIVINTLKKKQYQKILLTIQNKDHEAFKELLKNKLTTFLYPAVYLDNLRLSEAMLRGNKKDISDTLERLTKFKLSKRDRERVYAQAFNFYLSSQDTIKAKYWHEKIQELDNDRLKTEMDRTYNIYIEKGYKYLDDMLNELENIDPTNAGVNEYLISLMYENKGDKANAKKYRQLSEKHIKQLDEEIAKKHSK